MRLLTLRRTASRHITGAWPWFATSSSSRCTRTMIAHPVAALRRSAKRTADRLNMKIPPLRPSASRATQSPLLLRAMKNSGMDSFRTRRSGRRGNFMPHGGGSALFRRACLIIALTRQRYAPRPCATGRRCISLRQRAISCLDRRNVVSGNARFVRLTKYASSAPAKRRQKPEGRGSSTEITLIAIAPNCSFA